MRVFENRVLRRMFGSKRNVMIGGWRKLHNVELHSLYCSPSIIRIIKSRRVRLERHVVRIGRPGVDFDGKAGRKETTRKT
jgi:hypothetical protein